MNSVDPPGLKKIVSHGYHTNKSQVCEHLPIAVQANPITTPGGVSRYSLSCVNTGFPTNVSMFSLETSTLSALSFTIWKAAFLSICIKNEGNVLKIRNLLIAPYHAIIQ